MDTDFNKKTGVRPSVRSVDSPLCRYPLPFEPDLIFLLVFISVYPWLNTFILMRQRDTPLPRTGSARLQHSQQMADFVVHILGGRYRLRDLLGKQFTVALAEPVNGGLRR